MNSPAHKATLNHRRRKVAEHRLQQHYGVSWGTAETLSCVPDVAVPSMGWLIVFLLIQCLRLKWKKQKGVHPKASRYTACCSAVCWKVARRVHKVYRRRKCALDRKVFGLYLWYIVLCYIIDGKVHRAKMRCKKKLKSIFDRCKLVYVNVTFTIYRHIPPTRVSAAVIFLGLLMSGNVELNPGPRQGHLTINDLKDIIFEIFDARCKWENIGLQLEIKKSDLEAIDKECRGETQKCLTEMLTRWLRQGSSPTTWSTLISILKHKTVGFQNLAEEIESKMLPISNTSISHASAATVTVEHESDIGKKLYKCGCEKCTSKVELGCPNPIPVNDTFPRISNFKGLSEDEKKVLKARLRTDSKKIMVTFYKLLSSFYDSLTARKVLVQRLVTHLSIINAFDPIGTNPQTPLVQEHSDLLACVTDIEGVIEVIKLYSSFFNYEVLEHMIEHGGTDEDKAKMQKYKEDFIQYSRRRIYECPSYTGCEKKKGHIDMIIKLDSKYDAYALSALQDFRITLGELFRITPETLHLCKIEDGCIKLTFQIPNFVYKAVFPLSAEQEKALMELNVVQLTCGNYHFPKQESDNQDDRFGWMEAIKPGSSAAFKSFSARSSLSVHEREHYQQELRRLQPSPPTSNPPPQRLPQRSATEMEVTSPTLFLDESDDPYELMASSPVRLNQEIGASPKSTKPKPKPRSRKQPSSGSGSSPTIKLAHPPARQSTLSNDYVELCGDDGSGVTVESNPTEGGDVMSSINKPHAMAGSMDSNDGEGVVPEELAQSFASSQLRMLINMLQMVQAVQSPDGGGEDGDDGGQGAGTPVSPQRMAYEVTDSKGNFKRALSNISEKEILIIDGDKSYVPRPEWAKATSASALRIYRDTSELHAESTFKDLDLERDSLEDFVPIAEGQFGKVFKAVLNKRGVEPIQVAVKTAKKSSSVKEKEEFEREMKIMSQMMHPNIVRFYGVVQEDKRSQWIVLEYLRNGDLKNFLMKNPRPVKQLVKYMIDISMGMQYLAEKGLVHRDLAARNILVGDKETCKVTDFSLLQEIPKDDSIHQMQTNVPCPVRWMPPESLSQRKFSTASDVWSFGVLQWEMFNPKKTPYGSFSNMEVAMKVATGYRLPVPRNIPPVVARIMKACWHSIPEKRPSFLLISTLLTTKVTFDDDDQK